MKNKAKPAVKAFSGRFVGAGRKYNTFEAHVPAPLLRKRFTAGRYRKAVLRVCGLGFYELYLNGAEMTKGYLAPYVSNPDDILYYDEYDLTGKLREGENVLGFILGNGFLNSPGGDIWDFDKASFRDAPKLALSLEADGQTLFEADAGFKTRASAMTFDDLRAGVHYDARLEINGWNLPGFDDTGWDDAIPAKTPEGKPRIPRCEPIKPRGELAAVSVTKSGNGYIYDFGVNIAGIFRLEIDGARGQRLAFTCGEILKDDALDVRNISFGSRTRPDCMQTDTYICRGGSAAYIPKFTYHGFRYIYVEGITEEQAAPGLLTAIILHSDVRDAGGFACSDAMLNTLQEHCRRSALSNFHYFLTDCPHREKNGWTGDAALSADWVSMNFAAAVSYREWLHNVRAAQDAFGALPGIVPTAGWGFAWGNGPAWDAVITELPYRIYQYTGNKAALRENAGAIGKYIRYMLSRRNADGLLAFGLGDWCQAGRDYGSDHDTLLEITDSLTAVDILVKAAAIFGVLGQTGRRRYAETARDELINNFRKKYILNSRMRQEYATQTAAAMALYYGIFTGAEKQTVAAQLLSLIEKDGAMSCGILGARVLFRVLSEHGQPDLAYKLITRPEFPSYAYNILHGATSLCENFFELKDGGLWPKGLELNNSLNHHFFGDVSGWLIAYIGGIKVNPYFRDPNEVVLSPVFPAALSSASAWRDFPGGRLSVEWHRTENDIELRISVPKGIRARLCVAGADEELNEGMKTVKVIPMAN
ncbi:MAG: glycoside hydrolase family 78 protein [Firmicutes bacterium]|nr:glycoside hydrolase family 78 protein [Bacillota bacterium]